MSSFDNIIGVGAIDPLKARVVLFQTAGKFLHVPASGLGFAMLAADNTFTGDNLFTGTNEFDGTTNFDGATDFDGANVFDGAVTFNSVPSLAGGAILFPATQVPSANANALDDYEEGTFTPRIIGLTSAGTGTYTTQAGRYTKIGRLVYVEVSLTWTAHTGTGGIRIEDLPFTVGATHNPGCSVVVADLTFSNQIAARFLAGTTQIQPITLSTGAGLAGVNMDTAASIIAAGFYTV